MLGSISYEVLKGYLDMGNVISISKGSKTKRVLNVWNDTLSQSVDLTDVTNIVLTVKRDLDDPDINAVIQKTLLPLNGISISDILSGVVDIQFVETDTNNLVPRTYFYDIKIYHPDYVEYIIKNELFKVIDIVTRL
jgi:hypothetical protein